MSVILRIAYDGTDFHGWARQSVDQRGVVPRTVQGELERVLGELCGRPMQVRGASRTDAGVHANGQLAAFERTTPIPCENLVRALGKALPRDLVVTDAWEEQGERDVRRDNAGKHYRYRIRTSALRDPTTIRYEWHLGRALALAPMRDAAARLIGTHDFASFRAAACQAKTTVRTIQAVEIVQVGDELLDVHVHGLAFLHMMVRIIVGTLVEIGIGRMAPATIDELLATPDRGAAGRTAPPSGLTLELVRWPGLDPSFAPARDPG
ncbi:MAG TPA: tRNA pseudouridine(38-40) synthase TruA [Nannocystaceae bacterium]|nr:tRNA pseudouridine(38-40) synthase TruA [Nannocystaceae bacterium]